MVQSRLCIGIIGYHYAVDSRYLRRAIGRPFTGPSFVDTCFAHVPLYISKLVFSCDGWWYGWGRCAGEVDGLIVHLTSLPDRYGRCGGIRGS